MFVSWSQLGFSLVFFHSDLKEHSRTEEYTFLQMLSISLKFYLSVTSGFIVRVF